MTGFVGGLPIILSSKNLKCKILLPFTKYTYISLVYVYISPYS
ncbi:hypothetical protein Bsel_0758 [[Bacillus] selenitireducens MLS10]|uniref:Uncharacterized protein n=1 Tax=Bacillus selenitireducens (strain ATCC 700615 / DSM 15326 / MLS10) TaxID=439292 RepID=D6XYX9_BACIE|nr:hypothetical protein Bsel_0758 [[Bacillus] selenitireducens MLS10]